MSDSQVMFDCCLYICVFHAFSFVDGSPYFRDMWGRHVCSRFAEVTITFKNYIHEISGRKSPYLTPFYDPSPSKSSISPAR